VELYLHFLICLHVVHRDNFTFIYTLRVYGAEQGGNYGRRTSESGEVEKEKA
jgi:hypothetical protein